MFNIKIHKIEGSIQEVQSTIFAAIP